MIEIVYNKEKENAVGNEEYFCVPRNIRQIGDVPKENKIYVEDYVYTYLTADWKELEPKGKIAVLLGKYNWKNGTSYVFIKSAVSVEDIPVYRDNYPLTDEVWGKIYEEMKTYFPAQEVVGWYLSLPDSSMQITDGIVQTHIKHFGGNDKVLLMADPYERENAFYLYKNNQMERQEGYYVFYEKNDPMQEYMLAKNPDAETDYSGKIQDRAVKDFRKIAARKLEEKNEKGAGFSWIQVACASIIVLSLAAGTIWLQGQSEEPADNSEVVSSILEGADNAGSGIAGNNAIGESIGNGTGGDVTGGGAGNDALGDGTGNDVAGTGVAGDGSGNGMTDDGSGNGVGTGNSNENNMDNNSSESDGAGQGGSKYQDMILLTPEISENSQASSGNDSNLSQSGTSEETFASENDETDSTDAAISVYTKYTVRAGDTLSQISMRYYGDFSKVTEICKINDLVEEDVIYPGQIILLP